jgi:tetratricopeptide (TPR) repeat protein
VHAGQADDERERTRILSQTVGSLFWGSMHADEAIARCEEIRSVVDGDRAAVASCLVRLAGLRAMRGRFDDARHELAEARALLEEVGFPYLVARSRNMAGIVELLAGDFAAAERELEVAVEELEAMGERGFLATASALLAHAFALQGMGAEAELHAYRSEELGGADDRINQVLWRTARARALLPAGRIEEAEVLARVAAEVVAASDDARGRGDVLVVLAEVLAASRRADEAVPLVEQALELYQRKGVVPGEERARRLLEELGAPAQPASSSAR